MKSISLKPLNINYANVILKANTGNVQKYFVMFNNLEDVNKWIDDTLIKVSKGEKQEFVILNKDNNFVGMIAIWNKNKDTGEISIWIRESMQKKGYGKSALKLLLSKYSNGFNKLEYKVDAINTASIGLALSLNFKKNEKLSSHSTYLFTNVFNSKIKI